MRSVPKYSLKSAFPPDPSLNPDKGYVRGGGYYYGVLLVIVLCALWLRLDDLIAWHYQPARAYFNGTPILISFDGYYYLSLARDLVTHNYGFTDALRGIPHPPPSPVPPPLMSILAAVLVRMTPFSLEWVAAVMPALLGVTLAIPMVLLGKLFGGRLMALVAAALALFANYYVYRSHLGWFDTDCLNVTLLFLISYFFIQFGLIGHYRRYIYLAGAGVCALVFLWWWDQTPAIVILLCLLQLILVVALYYRPTGLERRIAIAVALSAVVVVSIWQGPQVLIAPFKGAVRQWGYIARQQTGDFPNVGISVHEQKRMDLDDLIKRTTGQPVAFGLGMIGILILFWRRKRGAAILAVPLCLGCLSFFLARRFIIFLNPVLALGLGYVAQWLWAQRSRWSFGAYLVPVLITISILLPFKVSWDQVYWPKEIPPIVEGLDAAGRVSDEDAVIWAWWDHGYPLAYYSRRATINDGSLHGGMRTVCNALPFSSRRPQFAANFMYFYVARGVAGIKTLFSAVGDAEKGMQLIHDVLSGTPEQAGQRINAAGLEPLERWERFFFPEPERDIYLFLDLRMARTVYWWSWFGTWDVGRRDGERGVFQLFLNCRQEADMIQGKELVVDTAHGWAIRRGRKVVLTRIYFLDGDTTDLKSFTSKNGLILIYHSQTRVAALMDSSFFQNNFNQLFLMNQPDDRFFTLQAHRFPYYQVWRVRRP